MFAFHLLRPWPASLLTSILHLGNMCRKIIMCHQLWMDRLPLPVKGVLGSMVGRGSGGQSGLIANLYVWCPLFFLSHLSLLPFLLSSFSLSLFHSQAVLVVFYSSLEDSRAQIASIMLASCLLGFFVGNWRKCFAKLQTHRSTHAYTICDHVTWFYKIYLNLLWMYDLSFWSTTEVTLMKDMGANILTLQWLMP